MISGCKSGFGRLASRLFWMRTYACILIVKRSYVVGEFKTFTYGCGKEI
jgi:hypothetical protein